MSEYSFKYPRYEVQTRPVNRDGWWIQKWFDTEEEADDYADKLEQSGEHILVRVVITRSYPRDYTRSPNSS